MLKIVSERKVWWPVEVNVGLDHGKIEKHSFEMQFVIRDMDGNRELLQSASELSAKDGQSLSELCAEFIMKIASDWKDVEGEDGKKLPYDKASLAKVMAWFPASFEAALEAFRDCSRGEKASRLGN